MKGTCSPRSSMTSDTPCGAGSVSGRYEAAGPELCILDERVVFLRQQQNQMTAPIRRRRITPATAIPTMAPIAIPPATAPTRTEPKFCDFWTDRLPALEGGGCTFSLGKNR